MELTSWWKHKDANFEEVLNEFELCNYSLTNEDHEVDLYVDHLSFNDKELIGA